MKGYVLLLMIACTRGYNLEYPGCLDILNAYKSSSTTTVSFNLNFIELTEFLHEERGEAVQEGALYHIYTGSRDEINAMRDLMRREYGTIAGILTVIMTILLGVYPSLVTDIIGPSVEALITNYDTALADGHAASQTAAVSH